MFKAEIKEASRELSKKEQLMLTDTTAAYKLEELTKGEEPVEFKPVMWAVLAVHNDKSMDPEKRDYEQYVVMDADGDKYITGSNTFYQSFRKIFDEMENSDEDWSIRALRKPSKNFQGRDFLTCALI